MIPFPTTEIPVAATIVRASLALLLTAGSLSAQAPVDIPYTRFTLPNGLTVLVHEDHKAPIVAVNVWYHVGSKNERARPDRLRAPVRAPDVQRERALRQGIPRAARAGGRHRAQRHHQRGPHQLLHRRADARPSTSRCSSRATGWATWSARSARPSSTSSAGWCRTRSARARTRPTARCGTSSLRGFTPATIRIPGPPSARWRTWTPPSSTT